MDPFDEGVEKARLHVAEAEHRLRSQAARVAVLAQLGCDTALAEKTLRIFEDSLAAMRHHLAAEEGHLRAYKQRRA